MVLDELVIRDGAGWKRIWLYTLPDGMANITHYDANEKRRIITAALPDDTAGIVVVDANGKIAGSIP